MSKKLVQKRQNVKPPSSITGAESTKKGVEVKPDWISFTFKSLKISCVEDVCEFLGIPFSEWSEAKSGGYGYMRQFIFGNIHIYFEGRDDMGLHVSMTGQGCREFEQTISGDWQGFIEKALDVGGVFTRFDSAMDDFQGHIDLNEIREYAESCKTVMRFTDWNESKTRSSANGKTRRDEVVFGNKSKSRIHIAFYDKALEQGVDTHWVRCEMRLKKDNANAFAIKFAESGDLGGLSSGVLINYLRFVEPSGDSNKTRWPLAVFWKAFVGEVKKVKLTMGKPEKTIQDTLNWIERQVAPALATVMRYHKGDMAYIDNLLVSGDYRMKPKHFALLQT